MKTTVRALAQVTVETNMALNMAALEKLLMRQPLSKILEIASSYALTLPVKDATK